jgi:hypothetical protein
MRTGHPRYRWVSGRQCVAFGIVRIIDSKPKQATFDVWLMD